MVGQAHLARRRLLGHTCCGVVGVGPGFGSQPLLAAATQGQTSLSPDGALALLNEGN